MTATLNRPERVERFNCFGGVVCVRASGDAAEGLAAGRRLALVAHALLSRFDPGSELSRLNRDPRELVPASPLLRRLAHTVRWAGAASGGLVDATGSGDWSRVRVSGDAVVRPAGVTIDGGGLVKGMVADLIAAQLDHLPSYVVDCRGDLRIGGTDALPRTVTVADPLDSAGVLHSFAVRAGGVATSGVTKQRGHLGDPRTGAPADTGIIQATALAQTALGAEVRAKTALLIGDVTPLADGGVTVGDLGQIVTVPALPSTPSG